MSEDKITNITKTCPSNIHVYKDILEIQKSNIFRRLKFFWLPKIQIVGTHSNEHPQRIFGLKIRKILQLYTLCLLYKSVIQGGTHFTDALLELNVFFLFCNSSVNVSERIQI